MHGGRWNAVHGGYFSDAAIARPLVLKALELAAASNAELVADLGGGNGFVLSELLANAGNFHISGINLDGSDRQVACARNRGITSVQGTVDAFERDDLGKEFSRILFLMRSVLHYFGQAGQDRVLSHIRSQAKPGDHFIHQTASFKDAGDADCINCLYEMMQTGKWYPSVEAMSAKLKATGWQLLDVLPAAPLALSSDSLADRYSLDKHSLDQIRNHLALNYDVQEDVFRSSHHEFCAYLHYWIYVCRACE